MIHRVSVSRITALRVDKLSDLLAQRSSAKKSIDLSDIAASFVDDYGTMIEVSQIRPSSRNATVVNRTHGISTTVTDFNQKQLWQQQTSSVPDLYCSPNPDHSDTAPLNDTTDYPYVLMTDDNDKDGEIQAGEA